MDLGLAYLPRLRGPQSRDDRVARTVWRLDRPRLGGLCAPDGNRAQDARGGNRSAPRAERFFGPDRGGTTPMGRRERALRRDRPHGARKTRLAAGRSALVLDAVAARAGP